MTYHNDGFRDGGESPMTADRMRAARDIAVAMNGNGCNAYNPNVYSDLKQLVSDWFQQVRECAAGISPQTSANEIAFLMRGQVIQARIAAERRQLRTARLK